MKDNTKKPNPKPQAGTPAPKPFFGSAELIAAKKKRAAELEKASKY